MAGSEIPITITGNLTADPELRFTANGTPVANFTVASTPRNYDRQANEWRDGQTTYLKCTVWREAAENVAESFHRGTPVVVSGKLITKKFTTRDNQERLVNEMDVDAVGPDLRYGTAIYTKRAKGNGGQQAVAQQQGGGQPQSGAPQDGANNDPWASPADNSTPANNQQASNNPVNDDPWA